MYVYDSSDGIPFFRIVERTSKIRGASITRSRWSVLMNSMRNVVTVSPSCCECWF